MNDALKRGDDIYSISVMVEVIASNPQEAVLFVDESLITEKVASNSRFVSFSVTAKSNEHRVTR
jgi:hypothetical protein